MHYNCLVIDDEKELAEATAEYFNIFGVESEFVTTAGDCDAFLLHNTVDVILLDINLENESGFSLCRKIRETSNIPILFISARQSDDDIVKALTIGGDDYIKKPYTLSVLLAKVKAVLKRCTTTEKANSKATVNGFEVDAPAMRVYYNGTDLKLKTMEFKLFYYLYQHANEVVTKEKLFQNVWGDRFFTDGTLNVHIRRLREKIEKDPNNPEIIKTIWGTGYIMEL